MIAAMPTHPVDVTSALQIATAKVRELRARAESAEAKLRLETARRVGLQEERDQSAAEIHTQRKTILDQKASIRALEDEIRRIKEKLRQKEAEVEDLVARSGGAAEPASAGAADDPTVARFKLIELAEHDP